jgi:hypothetical protein
MLRKKHIGALRYGVFAAGRLAQKTYDSNIQNMSPSTSPLQTSSKCALVIKILVRGPSCPAPVCRQTHDFLDALDVLRYFGQRRSSYTISLARFCVPCNCQKRDLVDSMFAGLRCSARWSTCMSSVILRKLSKRVQVYVMDLEAGVLLGV